MQFPLNQLQKVVSSYFAAIDDLGHFKEVYNQLPKIKQDSQKVATDEANCFEGNEVNIELVRQTIEVQKM